MRFRRSVVLAALAFTLAGCEVGVRPTGVMDAGEPASGLTRGKRRDRKSVV